MLLEDLLALPAGTQVSGDTENLGILAGVIESHANGAQFIRWDDGFTTIPFVRDRDLDEYIASRTHLTPTYSARRNAHDQDSTEETNQRDAEVCNA